MLLQYQKENYQIKEDEFQQEIQQLKQQNQEYQLENQKQLQKQKENDEKEDKYKQEIEQLQNQNQKLLQENQIQLQEKKENIKKEQNLQQEIYQLKKLSEELLQENQSQLQQLQENQKEIQKILNDYDKLKQQIQNQALSKFVSKKDEILHNWNISKQHYQLDYKSLEEFNNNFKIGKLIAEGSYGEIHQLKILDQENIHFQYNEYIVKILECNDIKESLQVKEALIFQQINQLPQKYRQYIITTLGTYWNHEENLMYIIQPKAKHSLHKEIKTRRKEDEYFNTLELQYQLGCSLLGLVTLDTLGIAHRDIKPENILVMNDGSIRIADLGEAKKLQYQVKEGTVYLGTPKYWAPENYLYFLELQKIHQQKNKDQDNQLQVQFYENDDYLQAQLLTKKDYSKSDLYSIGQCFLEATLLLNSVRSQGLDQNSIDNYLKKRKEQHQNIFLVLRNDPQNQDKVDEALKKLRLELPKESIPKLNAGLINLLEKIVMHETSQRISLEEALEELVKIQDW